MAAARDATHLSAGAGRRARAAVTAGRAALLVFCSAIALAHGPAAGVLTGSAPTPPPATPGVPAPEAAPAADATVALPEADQALVYDALRAIGSIRYTFYIGTATSEAAARSARERLGTHLTEAQVKAAGFQKKSVPAFQLPATIREVVQDAAGFHLSPPFALGDGRWALLLPVETGLAPMPPLPALREHLPTYIRAGIVPAPEVLRGEAWTSMLAADHALDAPSLARLPPGFDVNARLPNGETLLERAVLRSDIASLEFLLTRGAHIDQGAVGATPLHFAVRGRKPVELVDSLLRHGADPEGLAPAQGAIASALSIAAEFPDLQVAQMLLAHGADPNGGGGEAAPIVSAALKGNRPMVELLLAHDADPFRPSRITVPAYGALDAARAAKASAEFQAWLEPALFTAARQSGRYDWRGWIVQDGQRHEIGASDRIEISRRPFDIVISMRREQTLALAASTDASLYPAYAQGDTGSGLFSLANVSAHECAGPHAGMFVNTPEDRGTQPWTTEGWSGGEDRCPAYAEVAGGGPLPEQVRHVEHLTVGPGRTFGIEDRRFSSIYLVLGNRVQTTFPLFRYLGERRVELRFRD